MEAVRAAEAIAVPEDANVIPPAAAIATRIGTVILPAMSDSPVTVFGPQNIRPE
ncbi:hypothetical protein GCM10012289_17730 [Nonomuraea cavernae]|uniref:Uncharacterized protein n=1 Tax=Nonomuraea cavernae TaxID=2045107 RepID=A0A917YSD3_9ACTN|nr:hypothetical protein GCM10012289_17730 [Nonomuraea cavernae]